MTGHGYAIHVMAVILAVAIVAIIVIPVIGRMMDAAAVLRTVTG